jgi:hypothetical protein
MAFFMLSPICAAEKMDILFIAIDDMNDWTTVFDKNNPIQTPNLERLAARGALFEKAYCATPACTPSRTATLTGLRPTTSGVYDNRDHPWRKNLPACSIFTLHWWTCASCPKMIGLKAFPWSPNSKIQIKPESILPLHPPISVTIRYGPVTGD